MKVGGAPLEPANAEPYAPPLSRRSYVVEPLPGSVYYDTMSAAGSCLPAGRVLEILVRPDGPCSRNGVPRTPELPGIAAAVDVEPMCGDVRRRAKNSFGRRLTWPPMGRERGPEEQGDLLWKKSR